MKKLLSILVLLSFSFFSKAQELSAYEHLVNGHNKFNESDYSGAIINYMNALLKDSLDTWVVDTVKKKVIMSYDTIKINKIDIYNYVAACKTYLNSFNEALFYYDKVISIDSNYMNAFYNRGVVKFYLKDYKEALLDFNLSIARVPLLKESHEAKLLIDMREKNYEMTVLDANKGISHQVSTSNLYFYRGLAYFNLYDYVRAIEDFTASIEIKANFDKAYYNRGLAKYRLDKHSDACLDWEKASDLGYGNADKTLNELCKKR